MEYAYHVVDVFTTTPMQGNALAVFPDASGMDAATMQRVARELNLSETTFILPVESQDGATRVRIERAQGRTSSYVVSDIGAPVPAWWHCVHFAWKMRDTSRA